MAAMRKQVVLAVVGSVGIHFLVLFAWACTVQWFPSAEAAPNQPPEEIKVQVVEQPPDTPPPVEPEAAPKAPPPKPFVFHDTPDVPDASPPPKNADFQSDRNSEAASEHPTTGDSPLPTQKGKKIPAFAFDTQPFVPGDEAKTADRSALADMPPPVLETAPSLPHPVSAPQSVQSTPPPKPVAASADPRDFAMVAPRSIPVNPAEADPNPYDPSIRPPANMTEPPRPTPVPRRNSYHPQQERTETVGGVNKDGASSVSSEMSPAGRYIASVKSAVDSRYHQYADARADIITFGMVRIHFTVDRDGKVQSSRVVLNTANEALASVTLHALVDAQIPPMPTDVATGFDGGVLEMSINFTYRD